MSGLGLSLGLNRGSVLKPFDPLDLNPLLYFDARTSMLNSGGTQAGFLERVATFDNLTGGPDATHGFDEQRPRALPLIDGKGYLYTSGVTGNYAEFDEPILPLFADFELEVKFYRTRNSTRETLVAQYSGEGRVNLEVTAANALRLFVGSTGGNIDLSGGSIAVGVNTVKVKRFGTSPNSFAFQLFLNGTKVAESATADSISLSNINTRLGDLNGVAGRNFRGAIMSVNVAFNDVDCDFTSPNVRHGDTAFKCATGQTVTINKTGRDPSLLLRRPVLRFDGADTNHSRLRGVFSGDVNTAHTFMKFAVNGDDFEDSAPATLCLHRTDHWLSNAANIYTGNGLTGTNGRTYIGATVMTQSGLWNDDNGSIVSEIKISDGSHHSLINNASKQTDSRAYSLNSDKFRIAEGSTGGQAPLDLEQIVLFDRVVSEADAEQVVSFINDKHNAFLRHDTDGYYFYNPQSLSAGAVTSWNGRIVGSDNGDTDKNATQTTSADQPTADGYVVTFADNTDHLDIASTTQAGWQVVGTSIGTFAYRVNSNAVTELNLFGNAGVSRRFGDLYGIILLPASATGKDIEEARKLLIDRGAADGANSINFYSAWNQRSDMVEFKNVDMSSVTNVGYAWASSALTSFSTPLPSVTYAADSFRTCTSLTSFSSKLPLATNARQAWRDCTSLTSFSSELPSATDLSYAWYLCTSLESFSTALPSATSVAFAWRNCTSLTSFSTDLPLVTNASYAWYSCSSLTSFNSELPLVTDVNSSWNSCTSLTSFSTDLPSASYAPHAWRNCTSLTSFSTELPLVTNLAFTWQDCTSLESFSSELPLVTIASGTWRNCSSLTSFSTALPSVTIASYAWYNCTSLTSFSTALPSVTNASSAWRSCSSLTSFSTELPSATSASYAWYNCTSLTSFSSELPSATSVYGAWQNCTSLESFSSELPSVTNASYAWYNCSSLTSFITELPSATDVRYAWTSCTSLTSFSTELPSVTNASAAWYLCASLTSFSSELPSATDLSYTWQKCTSLSDFSADVFSNWNPSSISSGVFHETWEGCTSLTAQSVENILTSIDTSGQHATSTGASGGTALADATIDIDYDGTALTTATTTAITSLKAKGWSININNVIQ